MIDERQLTIADVGEVLPPGHPMSREEARRLVDRINAGFNSLRADLLALYEGKGYEALGYGNWRECVTAEFDQSQRRLYQELQAAQIEREVCTNVQNGSIPEGHLRPLAALTSPEERREAWQEAIAGDEPVTARKVEEAVRKVAVDPHLERLPEADRQVAWQMVRQPGIPAQLAQSMARKIAEADPEKRKEVINLYQSEDVRDRDRAMTWAADRVTPADPRLITLKECIRELKRCVREFPNDPEVSVIKEASLLLEGVVRQIRGSTQEVSNGSTDA